ncbi:MAG: U32 family peptidase [Spirochaetia bacterium]|jgi:putative protease|nr:U32 family peptidase [Spirochaetia bacterium]
MSELALPAGCLQSALVALDEGADAVYLGLKDFSARKGAVNFTFEEYAKLLRYAKSHDKKIYVTVNTIINESELDRLETLLRHLALLGCDGVIVQDLGVARLVKSYFPSLPLHGSTQLAIHTVDGVRQMQDFGFSRVVLARELTLEEIKSIRLACPDVELKVFIHGAMCYGFSGLCMASYIITGRSANRGICAQICRTWFTEESSGAAGWYFSMRDLNTAHTVRLLQQMGIDSLKVEGRMKGPEYVAAVARAYRKVLDGNEASREIRAMETVFSRSGCAGWLDDGSTGKARCLINRKYPAHNGIEAGTILSAERVHGQLHLQVRLSSAISLRDGLMYIAKGETAPAVAVKFSLASMDDSHGSLLTCADKGRTVHIVTADTTTVPENGSRLYLISLHDQHLKLINEKSLQMGKIPFSMTVRLTKSSLVLASPAGFLHLEETYPLDVSVARSMHTDWFQAIPELFRQSDKASGEAAEVRFMNESGIPDEQLFLPLSSLKKIRRMWYASAEDKLSDYLATVPRTRKFNLQKSFSPLPPRNQLITAEGLPFFRHVPVEIGGMLFIGDTYYVPLSPVTFDEPMEKKRLAMLLEKITTQGLQEKVRFGLNNLCQIKWFEDTKARTFVDYCLYVDNCEAAANLMEHLPTFDGGYAFFEDKEPDFSDWPFIPSVVGEAFVPPLFISRSCFRRDSMGLACKGCSQHHDFSLSQNGHNYKVLVRDCLTYVLQV